MTAAESHKSHEPACEGEIASQESTLDQTWGVCRARLWTCSVCPWRRWEPAEPVVLAPAEVEAERLAKDP